jgi:hypothetical protein
LPNEEIVLWLSRLARAAWRGVLLVLVLGIVAAPAALLFWAAPEGDGADVSVWAMGVSALTVLGVSVVLFGTGPKQATAKKDLRYGPPRKEKPIKRGQRIPDDARKEFVEGQDYALQRGVYFRGLFVGKDGRWSTSKLQALLWTYAVLFGLVSLIVAAWLGDDSGWETQKDLGLQEEYLILLGGPFAAAVLSKAITTQKVEAGTLPKSEAVAPAGSVGEGLREIISDDTGDTDLVDTQYFLFNLLGLGYFLGTFSFNLDQGFPELPDLLVGLTSVSAAAYVAKKATERGAPSLTSVFPRKARVGDFVDVWGRNIVLRVDDPPSAPRVEVGKKKANVEVASETRIETDRIRVEIPNLAAGATRIVAVTEAGTSTNELDFEVDS